MTNGWPTVFNSTDNAFYFIFGISLVLLLGVTITMIYFVIRYSRKRNPTASNIEGHIGLEITWTVLPMLIVLAMFWVGWKGFIFKRTVPDDAMIVHVVARMWVWEFQYGNGKKSPVLKLPLGKAVKLEITSGDVLHSVFIPAFRVKEDAVPGINTYLWFNADKLGSYDLFCTEYCGTEHSNMITKVEIVPAAEFQAWMTKPADSLAAGKLSPVKLGENLVKEKGCVACHSLDGAAAVGPSLKGLWGKSETVLKGRSEIIVRVDAEFIREALLAPEKLRVKGFPPIMPSLKGSLSETEIAAIVEYIKSLK